MNEPEEIRQVERDARKVSAELAEVMLRHPGSRWILGPIRRAVKWCERKANEWLKEEGWR